MRPVWQWATVVRRENKRNADDDGCGEYEKNELQKPKLENVWLWLRLNSDFAFVVALVTLYLVELGAAVEDCHFDDARSAVIYYFLWRKLRKE